MTGIYNKVMNFRHLDPTDSREGFSGGSEGDRKVWAEFYDPDAGQLKKVELAAEYERLWGRLGSAADAPITEISDEKLKAEVQKLDGLDLAALLDRYAAQNGTGSRRPTASSVTTRTYARSALVVAIARKRSEGHCEVPGCGHAPFETADGEPYSEVHHIKRPADGGEDVIENVACLCPSHHREVHIGKNRETLTEKLREVRSRL